MTKKIQAEKNIILTEELATYIVDNPDAVNEFPASSTFVIFTESDTKLNDENSKLLNSLHDKGESVIKAKRTDNPKEQWIFSAV